MRCPRPYDSSNNMEVVSNYTLFWGKHPMGTKGDRAGILLLPPRFLIKWNKEWGFIPKSYEGGRELRDRQHPVKEWGRTPMLHRTAEPQAKAPLAGL